jgi:hypothetical protein
LSHFVNLVQGLVVVIITQFVGELLEKRDEVLGYLDGPYGPIRPIGQQLGLGLLGGRLGLKSPPSIKDGGEVSIQQARSRN